MFPRLGSESVLFVDDEAMSRKWFSRAFADEFNVVTAAGATEALQVLAERGQEFAVLAGIFERQRKTFAADAKAAQALVRTGNYRPAKGLDVAEHAAWAAVANVVLNLDETITRE